MSTTATIAPAGSAPAGVPPARKKKAAPIPDHLIYETLDGIPLYYAGYEQVLSHEKTLEDIMGYGLLQWVLLNQFGDALKPLLGEKYVVLIGEGGLHLSKRSNPSLDLAVFERGQILLEDLENKYAHIPPQLIVEVDTKAHLPEVAIPNYYQVKTQRLLDFGVKQVVWIFTNSRKVTTATNDAPWLTANWHDDIQVMGHTLNLQALVERFGREIGQ